MLGEIFMTVKKVMKKSVKKTAKKSVKKALKKTVSKKTTPKKPTAKKTVAKKTTAKKTTAKKTVVKKTAAKKSPAKKTTRSTSKAASKANSKMPVVGQLAPDFALQSDTNGTVSLSRYVGKNVVLYFYPKDDTPGCTREACSFQEHKSKLMSSEAIVIGVSPDSVESHAKFRSKYGLDFVLVADEDRELCQAYGVWVEKNNYGKKYMGVQRATFLIDRHGRVAYVWPKVSVDGHTEEVLHELSRLG
jgi:peroxiredoxin Q/BCP